ncbi:PAS domain-containing protein [Halovenus marina]|uniref:PAS domain-containing protein n=1 Tax=Halovenus marina TaxID=3396621 RepID=UPI003F56FFDD
MEDSVVAAVVFLVPVADRDLVDIILWIAGGCLGVGVLGWVATAVLVSGLDPMVGFGTGFAVGGGLGAMVRLVVLSEESDRSETVTVEMDEADDSAGPEPVDLFEASPDPMLYYDDSDGPTVRAVNPAFEAAFGISTASLADEALKHALMTSEGVSAAEAASRGDRFDGRLSCETTEGVEQFRVRVIPVAPARGYVVFTASLDESPV